MTNDEFVQWFNDGYDDAINCVSKDTVHIEFVTIKATLDQQEAYWQGYTAAEEDIGIDDEACDR